MFIDLRVPVQMEIGAFSQQQMIVDESMPAEFNLNIPAGEKHQLLRGGVGLSQNQRENICEWLNVVTHLFKSTINERFRDCR